MAKPQIRTDIENITSTLADIVTVDIKKYSTPIAPSTFYTVDMINFQNAINNMPQSDGSGSGGGGTIGGMGTFIISSPIIIQNHNTTFKGTNKGAFTIKASDAFVGDALLKWNTGGKWLYLTNCTLNNVTFDCNDLAIKGVELRSWYDNCDIKNINVKKFKDTYGFDIDKDTTGVSILQGIRLEGIEVSSENISTSPVVMIGNLFESSMLNCKFWNAQADNTKNNVDVVIIKRCRGLAIMGGSCASGKSGYVVLGEGASSSEHVNFFTPTIENLDVGIEFRGSATAGVNYCNIYGVRKVLPITKDILYDYSLGCKLDVDFSFNIIELTANSRNNLIFGFASGGTIANNHTSNMIMTYGTTEFNIDKTLKFKNGTSMLDDGTRTMIKVDGDKLQILNEVGAVVIAELSVNQSLFNTYFRVANQNYTTIAPSAGGAGVLPATPAGYWAVKINGTDRQIPYY